MGILQGHFLLKGENPKPPPSRLNFYQYLSQLRQAACDNLVLYQTVTAEVGLPGCSVMSMPIAQESKQ